MSVHLHVEQIVLDGLPMSPGSRRLFAEAFTHTLQRHLGAGGAAATSQHQRIQTPVLLVAADATPAQLGRQLAVTIANGLSSPGPAPGSGAHSRGAT